jgi:hypothetical protein
VQARVARVPVCSAVAAGSDVKAEKPLNVVFVSAEVAPWSKTGGLGDVVRALPGPGGSGAARDGLKTVVVGGSAHHPSSGAHAAPSPSLGCPRARQERQTIGRAHMHALVCAPRSAGTQVVEASS